MGYREARELARIRTELRERLMSRKYDGAPRILSRFGEIADDDDELRGEVERWRMRFRLIAA